MEKLFLQHRLLFWYNDKAEMTTLFEAMQIACSYDPISVSTNFISCAPTRG